MTFIFAVIIGWNLAKLIDKLSTWWVIKRKGNDKKTV